MASRTDARNTSDAQSVTTATEYVLLERLERCDLASPTGGGDYPRHNGVNDLQGLAARMSWGEYIRAVFCVELVQGPRWITPALPGQPHNLIFPDSAGRTVYVITAFNPAGKAAPDEANAVAHQQLTTRLQEMGATYLAAAGGNPEWTHVEPSLAVIGMSEEDARALGREFGQDAIFGWSPTTLTVLSCDTDKVHMTGWDVLGDPVE